MYNYQGMMTLECTLQVVNPFYVNCEILTRHQGAPGYGPPPAFGSFSGGNAPPGMGAPPGTGRQHLLKFDSVS